MNTLTASASVRFNIVWMGYPRKKVLSILQNLGFNNVETLVLEERYLDKVMNFFAKKIEKHPLPWKRGGNISGVSDHIMDNENTVVFVAAGEIFDEVCALSRAIQPVQNITTNGKPTIPQREDWPYESGDEHC